MTVQPNIVSREKRNEFASAPQQASLEIAGKADMRTGHKVEAKVADPTAKKF
jgi:hypothetical protein